MKIGLLCGREYSFPPAFIERVNQLGYPHGITAEMVKFGGTQMDEPSGYRVIVDRISHEVEYYRGALKHAVLHGAYVINNPFWWTADDKYFNYSVMHKLGLAIPRTVLLPQKGYPADVDLTPESLRNLVFPIRGMYLEAIDRASDHIYLTHAYLIPDDDMVRALTQAADRGVDVRIIVPEESNHIVADWLSRGFYTQLLRGGVRAVAGKHRQPSTGIIDSQSVKTTERGGSTALMSTNRPRAASAISSSTRSG